MRMSRHFFHTIIMWGFLLQVFGSLSGCTPSDEQILRQEFDLPTRTKLVMIESYPKSLVREGLKIDATFEFSSSDFDTYRNNVERDSRWQPLPLSRDFLVKITGVRQAIEYRQRRAERQGEPLPEAGSIYNPTEDQLLEQWKENLPLDVKHGFYHCLTAGDNIMLEKKVPCSEKPGDLNDFMLGILDLDNKTLRVKVHTSY